jgi:hypothetical protein
MLGDFLYLFQIDTEDENIETIERELLLMSGSVTTKNIMKLELLCKFLPILIMNTPTEVNLVTLVNEDDQVVNCVVNVQNLDLDNPSFITWENYEFMEQNMTGVYLNNFDEEIQTSKKSLKTTPREANRLRFNLFMVIASIVWYVDQYFTFVSLSEQLSDSTKEVVQNDNPSISVIESKLNSIWYFVAKDLSLSLLGNWCFVRTLFKVLTYGQKQLKYHVLTEEQVEMLLVMCNAVDLENPLATMKALNKIEVYNNIEFNSSIDIEDTEDEEDTESEYTTVDTEGEEGPKVNESQRIKQLRRLEKEIAKIDEEEKISGETVRNLNLRWQYNYNNSALTKPFEKQLQVQECKHEGCKNRVVLGLPFCRTHMIENLKVIIFDENVNYETNESLKEYEDGVYAYDLSKSAEGQPVFNIGDIILTYQGDMVPESTMNKKYGKEVYLPYSIKVKDQQGKAQYIDGSVTRHVLFMIQHSNDPNVEVVYSDTNGVQLKALKNIPHGGELTRYDPSVKSKNERYSTVKLTDDNDEEEEEDDDEDVLLVESGAESGAESGDDVKNLINDDDSEIEEEIAKYPPAVLGPLVDLLKPGRYERNVATKVPQLFIPDDQTNKVKDIYLERAQELESANLPQNARELKKRAEQHKRKLAEKRNNPYIEKLISKISQNFPDGEPDFDHLFDPISKKEQEIKGILETTQANLPDAVVRETKGFLLALPDTMKEYTVFKHLSQLITLEGQNKYLQKMREKKAEALELEAARKKIAAQKARKRRVPLESVNPGSASTE